MSRLNRLGEEPGRDAGMAGWVTTDLVGRRRQKEVRVGEADTQELVKFLREGLAERPSFEETALGKLWMGVRRRLR